MQTSQRTALKESVSSGYSLPITRNPSHSRAVQLPSKLKATSRFINYWLQITSMEARESEYSAVLKTRNFPDTFQLDAISPFSAFWASRKRLHSPLVCVRCRFCKRELDSKFWICTNL